MNKIGLSSIKWAFALLLVAFSAAPTFAEQGERHLWHPWFELGGFYNSDDASRGEGILFTPLMHGERDMLFADIRMKFFEDDVREGNFALGYRVMSASGFNFGVWIGADVRETQQDNRFSQLSGGFEALSNNFDFRVNWYGPGTDSRLGGVGFTEVFLAGNNIFIVGGEEISLQGVDGEIGVRFPVELLNINPNLFELRVYGGGFYFDNEDATEAVAGGKARVVLAINDIVPQFPGSRLTAEYEFSYDDVREERHEVGGRLRIPLTAPSTTTALSQMSPQERRMMDGLERDTDIITVKSKRENVEDVLTGVDFDRVAFVNNGGSITNKSTAAGANSLLIVNGTVTGAQTVIGNQTVQGGGSTIQVRGLRTGAMIGFTAPGSKPRVTSPAGDILTLLGSNTHIRGLLIDGQGTSGDGINGGSDKTNIVIAGNMIRNTGNDGINFEDNNDGIRILDNMITDTAANEGIDFGNDNSNVTIDGNTIMNPRSDGILFNNRNTNIFVTNNIISGGVDEGIEFDDDNSNIRISGNTISGFGDEGIDFEDDNSNVTISNNTIFGVGDEGIEFDDDNSNITITGNTINAGGDGIEFDDDNSNVTITGNTITATDDAIFFDDDNSNVRITGNTLVAGGNDEGVEFDNDNTNITIANNMITAGDDGIFFDNRNTGLSITGNTITSLTEDAIELDNNNSGTISGNTLTAANGDGINLNNDNVFTISGNTFNAIGDDAIRIRANNTIGIAGNIFNGPIGGQLLDVDGNGNALSGIGNVSNVVITCQSGTFTGTVTFVGGTVLQDGVAPCN